MNVTSWKSHDTKAANDGNRVTAQASVRGGKNHVKTPLRGGFGGETHRLFHRSVEIQQTLSRQIFTRHKGTIYGESLAKHSQPGRRGSFSASSRTPGRA